MIIIYMIIIYILLFLIIILLNYYYYYNYIIINNKTEKEIYDYNNLILLILGIIIIIILLIIILIIINNQYNDYLLKINGLVNINDINPTIVTDMKYYTKNNFMKEKLYINNKCMLQKQVATKLSKIHEKLKKKLNIRLKVYDCYRPKFIQKKMYDKINNIKYVDHPNNSNHCKGSSVDLILINSKGKELKMPTKFDNFSIKSGNNYKFNKNKNILDKYMLKEGFKKNKNEWWHYNYDTKKKYPILNIPI